MIQRTIVLLTLLPTIVLGVEFFALRTDKAINNITVELKNSAIPGKLMPISGLGTSGYNNVNYTFRGEYWGDDLTFAAVQRWLAMGGKRIDASADAMNLKAVGNALVASGYASGPKRAEIFITIKVGPRLTMDRSGIIKQVHESLAMLQTSYVDLTLIHWPARNSQRGPAGYPPPDTSDCISPGIKNPSYQQCRHDAWQSLINLWHQGYTHAIGVANFEKDHIEDIRAFTGVCPAVNQIEFHPFWSQQQMDLLDYLFSYNILPNGYSSLGAPDFMDWFWKQLPLNAPAVTTIAKRYGKTNAQVLLRFSLDLGLVVNPRASSSTHQQENLDANLIGWNLTPEEIQTLLSIPNDSNVKKVSPDPRKMT